MIIVDYNHLLIEASSASLNRLRKLEPRFMRFIFLKRLGKVFNQFKDDYGNPVICRESKGNWRKKVFKEYKANRKISRAKDSMDWNTVYSIGDQIARELEGDFHYPVISIDGYEADDIISAIVRNDPSNHIIISRDKDFLQLNVFGNVSQWDCIGDKFVELPEDETLDEFVCKMFIKGQQKDGVPNVFSRDYYLVEKIRQSPVSQKMIDELVRTSFDKFGYFERDKAVSTIISNDMFKNVREKNNLTRDDIEKHIERNVTLLSFLNDNQELEDEVEKIIKHNNYSIDFTDIMEYFVDNGLDDISGNMEDYVFQ